MTENYIDNETQALIDSINASRATEETKARAIDELKAEAYRQYLAKNRKPIGTDRPTIQAGKVLGLEEYEAKKRTLIPGYDDAKKRVLEGLAESKKRFGAAESVNRGPFDYSIARDKAESQRVKDWAARKGVEIEANREARTNREVAAYDKASSAFAKHEILKRISPEALNIIKQRMG